MTNKCIFLDQKEWLGEDNLIPPSIFSCLITRLNLYNSKYWQENGLLESEEKFEEWTTQRVKCLKISIASFLNLSIRPEKWYILIDEKDSKSIQEIIDTIEKIDGSEVIKFIKIPRKFGWSDFVPYIRKFLMDDAKNKTHLLATRLDSDDCLNKDYYRALISALDKLGLPSAQYKPISFNFPVGVMFDGSSCVVSMNDKNAFSTLLEPLTKNSITPYVGSHKVIDQYADICEVITREPMWCVNIHGHNIGTTHVRQGSRTTTRSGGFCVTLDLKLQESVFEIFGMIYDPIQKSLKSEGETLDISIKKSKLNPLFSCYYAKKGSTLEVESRLHSSILNDYKYAFYLINKKTKKAVQKIMYQQKNFGSFALEENLEEKEFIIICYVREKASGFTARKSISIFIKKPNTLFKIIATGDFDSIKKDGFIARKGVAPIFISIPMQWLSDDKNIEFNLHSWRFLNSACAYYMNNPCKQVAKEVFQFSLGYIQDWSQFVESKKSNFAWYDMSVGIRAIHIAFMKYLIEEYLLDTDDEDFGIIDRLAFSHIDWLSNQKNITEGNHAVYEIIGLAILSYQYKLNQNNAYMQRNMTSLMSAAFDDHFVNTENSPFYHKYNIDLFRKVPSFLFPDIKDRIDHILKNAPLVTKWLTAPNGYFYRIGDTEGRGVLLSSQDVTQSFANHNETVYRDFGESGYQIIRSHPSLKKEESFSLVFRGKTTSYIHSHCDANSFIFFNNGEEVFADPGKFTYEHGEWKNWFISDKSHNTAGLYEFPFYPRDIELNAVKTQPVKEECGCFFLSGEVRKSEKFIHTRSISFTPHKSIIISDKIENSGEHKTEIRYILGKGFEYFHDKNKAYIKSEKNFLYQISFSGDIERIEYFNRTNHKAWISETYKEKYATGIIIIHCPTGVSFAKMQLDLVNS